MLFILPLNASEQNLGSLLLFLFHGTDFRAVFSFADCVGTKFRICFYFCSTVQDSEHYSLPRNGSELNSKSFLFRGATGIPPEITICFVSSVLRGIIFFCQKLPTPTCTVKYRPLIIEKGRGQCDC